MTKSVVDNLDSAEAAPRGSLKQRLSRGFVWIVAGFGTQQALRLGSNLLLTRLLFPEAFGLMAFVNSFMTGFELLSDVGLRSSIVYHDRGDEPAFLNTAWTIQVIRGGLLSVGAVLIAHPVAMFYDEPMLGVLLPVTGIGALIRGFGSINTSLASRNIQPGLVIRLTLITQVVQIAVMVALAWAYQSVWALVIGGLIHRLIWTLLSHKMFPGPTNQFRWDRQAAREMFRFGRWVLISTAIGFLLGDGDRLILGKLMTTGELGVYAIAANLVSVIKGLQSTLQQRLLQPVYSELWRRGDIQGLRSRTFRTRLVLTGLILPPIWICVIFGQPIVRFLYDARYADAGWMFSIIAVGCVGSLINGTTTPIVIAAGDSFRMMLMNLATSAIMVVGIVVGGYFGGATGVIVAMAGSNIATYPFVVLFIRKYHVWLPGLDLAIFASSALVILLCWL